MGARKSAMMAQATSNFFDKLSQSFVQGASLYNQKVEADKKAKNKAAFDEFIETYRTGRITPTTPQEQGVGVLAPDQLQQRPVEVGPLTPAQTALYEGTATSTPYSVEDLLIGLLG